jgi:hypothetical protein
VCVILENAENWLQETLDRVALGEARRRPQYKKPAVLANPFRRLCPESGRVKHHETTLCPTRLNYIRLLNASAHTLL